MTIGEDFSYNFNKSLLGDGSVKLDVDLGKVASWANYDSTDRMLHGHVPADLQPQTFSVKLIATRGSTKETRNLDINVSSQGNSSGSGGGVRRKQKACVIALAVVVPVVAIVVRFSYFFASGGDAQPPPKIPELDCQPIEYNTEPEKSETRHSSISSTPPPPKLELNPLWAADSLRKRREETGNMADEENQLTRSTVEWKSGKTTSSDPKEEKQVEEAIKEAKHLFQNSLRRSSTN